MPIILTSRDCVALLGMSEKTFANRSHTGKFCVSDAQLVIQKYNERSLKDRGLRITIQSDEKGKISEKGKIHKNDKNHPQKEWSHSVPQLEMVLSEQTKHALSFEIGFRRVISCD